MEKKEKGTEDGDSAAELNDSTPEQNRKNALVGSTARVKKCGISKQGETEELSKPNKNKKHILLGIQEECTGSTECSTLQVGSMFVALPKTECGYSNVGGIPTYKSSVEGTQLPKVSSLGTVSTVSTGTSGSIPNSPLPAVPKNKMAGSGILINKQYSVQSPRRQQNPKFLETQHVWSFRALYEAKYEDRVSNSELLTVHHFSALKKMENPAINDSIKDEDLPKLARIWPSLKDRTRNEDFWSWEYGKNGTGMLCGNYFSKVLEIYTEFTKELDFIYNRKMMVADFEDRLSRRVPAKCRIMLVKAKNIIGLQNIADNVYLLLSLMTVVKIDPPFTVYKFEKWQGDGAMVKVRIAEKIHIAMTDKTTNFVIVPQGTITNVIEAALSDVESCEKGG